MAGSIPLPDLQQPQQQQQQTATQGVDILNELLKQRQQLTDQMGPLYKQATIPVAGGGAGTSPQLALRQIQPFQPAPLIDRPTVGARSTRDKGIANTIIAASNLVGQYREKHDLEQQRVLAVDLERVFQAQDGIREAQQTLQLDPNNPDAKQTIQKNTNIIDAMLSDPKRRKQFEKALDISFTDPSKNDQMEHGALQKAAQSYSQQFEKQVPQQMQPNVVAQQKLALMTAQQQSIDKMIGQITPTLLREQGAQARAQMTDQTRRDIAEYQTTSRENVAKFTAGLHYQGVIDAANIHKNALLSATAMRNQQSAENLTRTLQTRMDIASQRQNDPRVQLKLQADSLRDIAAFSNSLTNQNAKLTAQQAQLAGLYKAKMMSKEDYDQRSKEITSLTDANNETLNQLRQMHTQGASYIENLTKGLQSGTGSSDTSIDRFTSESGQTIGSEEDTEGTDLDPDNY
jgi:hypothetical protein